MHLKSLVSAGILAAFLVPAGASAGVLDFDTLGAGGPSSPGNLVGNEFEEFDVLLSSNKQLALFNSNCGPDDGDICDSVGTDGDLATGPFFDSEREGNVLIINGGTNADPNDDPSGGLITFDFTQTVDFTNLRLIDLDEQGLFDKMAFTFTFADNSSQTFAGNSDLAGISTLLNPGFPGDNSVRDIMFGLSDVDKLVVEFDGVSGAIASVSYTPIPLPAGLPLLAAGLGGLAMLRRIKATA